MMMRGSLTRTSALGDGVAAMHGKCRTKTKNYYLVRHSLGHTMRRAARIRISVLLDLRPTGVEGDG